MFIDVKLVGVFFTQEIFRINISLIFFLKVTRILVIGWYVCITIFYVANDERIYVLNFPSIPMK